MCRRGVGALSISSLHVGEIRWGCAAGPIYGGARLRLVGTDLATWVIGSDFADCGAMRGHGKSMVRVGKSFAVQAFTGNW